MEKVEGNIKPSGKQGYSTAPAWKDIRGLHKICEGDVGTNQETDKYIAWL